MRQPHFDSEWTLNGHDLMKVSRSECHFSYAEFRLLKIHLIWQVGLRKIKNTVAH